MKMAVRLRTIRLHQHYYGMTIRVSSFQINAAGEMGGAIHS